MQGYPKLDIEEVFASRGRTRVLNLLIHNIEMSISSIAQQGGLNHRNVQVHLEVLIKLGLVQEKKFGRIRIFRLRAEDKRVNALKNLVEFWEDRTINSPMLAGGISPRT